MPPNTPLAFDEISEAMKPSRFLEIFPKRTARRIRDESLAPYPTQPSPTRRSTDSRLHAAGPRARRGVGERANDTARQYGTKPQPQHRSRSRRTAPAAKREKPRKGQGDRRAHARTHAAPSEGQSGGRGEEGLNRGEVSVISDSRRGPLAETDGPTQPRRASDRAGGGQRVQKNSLPFPSLPFPLGRVVAWSANIRAATA